MTSLKVAALNSFINSFTWTVDELNMIKQNAEKMIGVYWNSYYKGKLLDADVDGKFMDKIMSSFIKIDISSYLMIDFRSPNGIEIGNKIRYDLFMGNGIHTVFRISQCYDTCSYSGTPDDYQITYGKDNNVPSDFREYGMFIWRTLIKN